MKSIIADQKQREQAARDAALADLRAFFHDHARARPEPASGRRPGRVAVSYQLVFEPGDPERAEFVEERLKAVPNAPGLYAILSDYPEGVCGQNGCRFKVDGLPGLRVVYRGHSSGMQDRLLGHLAIDAYHARKDERSRWGRYVRLDPQRQGTGVNVTDDPLRRFRWAVVAYRMDGSNLPMRELAEVAFADVFGMPPLSADEPGAARSRK